MRMLALDTEDDSQGTVTWINFYDGRKHRAFRGGEQRAAWQYLLDRSPCTVFACNMEYDLVNLYGDWVDKLTTLQYTDSGFLRAAATYGPIQFYDTLRHWPAVGVKRMGEFLGMPKLGFDPDSLEYCQRDTEIVWRFVAGMLERYQGLGLALKSTLPSMAFQLWRTLWKGNSGLPLHLNSVLRQAYYGGRVECFYLGPFASAVYHYDFTSLYPAAMVMPFPSPSSWRMTGKPNLERDGVLWGILRVPAFPIPPLPLREDGELIFPVGRLYGAWTYEEVRNALLAGVEIEQVREAIEFPRANCTPFYDYIHKCMKEKDRSDGIDREFWKLMLNSLYGKFGQESALTIISNGRERTFIPKQPKHVNVLWAATITARARVMLWRAMLQAKPLYYCDTDSLFTEQKLTTGTGLGMIREVGTYRGGHFFGNKCYVIEDKATAKGIPKPREGQEDYPMQFLIAGRTLFRKPARLREARRQGLVPNKWYPQTRVRDPDYRKRRGDRGFTEPWDLHEYRERFI